jgi:hypothetical protein
LGQGQGHSDGSGLGLGSTAEDIRPKGTSMVKITTIATVGTARRMLSRPHPSLCIPLRLLRRFPRPGYLQSMGQGQGQRYASACGASDAIPAKGVNTTNSATATTTTAQRDINAFTAATSPFPGYDVSKWPVDFLLRHIQAGPAHTSILNLCTRLGKDKDNRPCA